MKRIHPICEEKIRPCVGKPVCAVLRDGSCFQGIVQDVRDGKIYFAPVGPESHISRKSTRKKARIRTASKHRRMKAGKAKTNAWGGWGYPGFYPGFGARTFALDLALIALLFTIPFIGFPFFI